MSGTEGWWIDFVAGWVSGAVSVLACQPLDTVLTRYQAGQTLTSTAEVNVAASVRGLAKDFGIVSLWRGSSPMIGVVPFQNALLMGGYGIGKQYSGNASNALIPVFVGGCAGGVLQSFLVSPVEWIKVHQQTRGASPSNLLRSLQQQHHLWHRGLMATLLRDGIPHGVWFASYEYCKTEMTSNDGETKDSGGYYESVTVPLVSGAFAATSAWAVGYPFDIIKTRIQATKGTSLGVMETAKQLVAEADGNILRGLYRGFGLKLIRSIPASMIGFFTYEMVSSKLIRA